MSAFKFSCPHCQQHMQVTSEYVGLQINCPGCQQVIVVPEEPHETTPGGARKARLTMNPGTVEHGGTSGTVAAAAVRSKKKIKWGLYIGLAAGAAAAVVAAIFVPQGIDKYKAHKAEVEAQQLVAQKAADLAAHPPPELTADEILKKVNETYQGMSSLSMRGQSVGSFDLSQLAHAATGNQVINTKVSLLLGRPGHYRFEWERPMGQKVMRGAAWSAGKGDFVKTAANPTKVKTQAAAISMAASSSMSMTPGLAELFFSAPDNLPDDLKKYSKQSDEGLNGHKCYVISGEASMQKVALWIERDSFLIEQIKMTLSGQVDPKALATLPPAEKVQAQMMARMKGDITETYSDIQTNKELAASDFEKPLNAAGAGATPVKHKKEHKERAKLE
jgi:outer membrane lipoprotein-sorting protein